MLIIIVIVVTGITIVCKRRAPGASYCKPPSSLAASGRLYAGFGCLFVILGFRGLGVWGVRFSFFFVCVCVCFFFWGGG